MNAQTKMKIEFCTTGIHEKSGKTGSIKTKTRLFLSVALVPVVLFGPAIGGQAQIAILEHAFAVDTSATTMDSSIVQSSVFSGSALNNFSVANDGFGVVLQAYASALGTSASASLANDDFWDLTITAQPGQSLNIGSLFFEVGKGGGSDPRGYFIRSSVDAFAADVFGSQLPTGAAQAPQPASVDLSGFANYQGLASVEFRFYVWAPNTGNSVDWRNVGLTAVPEPAGYAFVSGLACLVGAVLWRHRRDKRERAIAGSP